MSKTDITNPELSKPESGKIIIGNVLKAKVIELDNEVRAIRIALDAQETDEKHRRDFGQSFAQKWDPLKKIGMVSSFTIDDTAVTVREMAVDPIDRLRDGIDEKSNSEYLDGIVGDSFLDKEQALNNALAAFSSPNYTPVRYYEEISGEQ